MGFVEMAEMGFVARWLLLGESFIRFRFVVGIDDDILG
jgi:hypothetical protein